MRGFPPDELTERNKSLIRDYESRKYSMAELSEKYGGISRQRIWRIVRRAKKRQQFYNLPGSGE